LEEFSIKSWRGGAVEEKIDRVTEEAPLTIELNGQELATLLCSPSDLKCLALGFLYTSGIIEDAAAVRSLAIDQERWKAYVETVVTLPPEMLFKRIYTSGCGKGIIFHNTLDLVQRVSLTDNFTMSGESLIDLMKTFITSSEEFRQTGGVHSAALFSAETTIFKDDLGRHNAIDKVIGEGLLQKVDFTSQVALTSGRISSEIVTKMLRCRIPILASSGAPTNQAVKLARGADLTLLGFVRGQRMNVYSGERRVLGRKAAAVNTGFPIP